MRSVLAPLAIALLAGLPACASWYADRAEEDAHALLEDRTRAFDRDRRATFVDPSRVPPGEREEAAELPPAEVPPVLPLREALRIATERNRDYLTQREGLEISALSVLGVRHQYELRFSSSLAYSLSDRTGSDRVQRGALDLGVSRVLPTGGDLSLSGTTTATRDENASDPATEFASAVTARLTQPLLRGAGREVRYESLTQAERDLLYSIRSFELFRQDFAIRITRQFFALLDQKARIENSRLNLEQSRFLRDRSTKFFEVGRGSELDKFRAEQEYLQAEDRLNEEVEQYDLLLDRFKVDLGLPLSVEFEVSPERPEVEPLEVTLRQAVEAALANRLDLRTSRDRLEDAERSARIARQNLLPALDLAAAAQTSWLPDRSFLGQPGGETSYDLGVTLEIPLDRVSERNAYRRALIDVARSQRASRLDEDNVLLEVRDALRSLERIHTSLLIQEKSLLSEEKRFRVAQLRYREGKLGNRDIVEAQNSLLDVKNRIVQLKSEYLIERLQLLRTMGTLFLDENGVPIR